MRLNPMDDVGDELSKRVENFGFPVGKSAPHFSQHPMYHYLLTLVDDPSVPPVLIARLGKGQEIKARCIAKKVRSTDKPNYVERGLITVLRVSQKNMPSGHRALLSRSSTTHTTSSGIRRTGMNLTLSQNGR